jgi:hypothetical protein
MNCGEAAADLLDLRRRGPVGSKACCLHLDASAQLHDVPHVLKRGVLVEIDAVRPADMIGDKLTGSLACDDQTVGLQSRYRLAHDGAADAGGCNHFPLCGQPRPRREFAIDDIGRQASYQLRSEAPRTRQWPQQRITLLRMLLHHSTICA